MLLDWSPSSQALSTAGWGVRRVMFPGLLAELPPWEAHGAVWRARLLSASAGTEEPARAQFDALAAGLTQIQAQVEVAPRHDVLQSYESMCTAVHETLFTSEAVAAGETAGCFLQELLLADRALDLFIGKGEPLLGRPSFGGLAVRFILGVVLIVIAGDSRFPILLQIIGGMSIAAGAILVMLPRARFEQLITWLLGRFGNYVRIGSVVPFLFGGFLIYAVV
jgi:hypothetical protein